MRSVLQYQMALDSLLARQQARYLDLNVVPTFDTIA